MQSGEEHDTTLYDAICGEPVLAAAVDELYARTLANPRLAAFFAGVSLDALRQHQREFLTLALGGPALYAGRTLHDAHTGRGITDADFDRLLIHLAEAFTAVHEGFPAHNVTPALVTLILDQLQPYRAEIVTAVLASVPGSAASAHAPGDAAE